MAAHAATAAVPGIAGGEVGWETAGVAISSGELLLLELICSPVIAGVQQKAPVRLLWTREAFFRLNLDRIRGRETVRSRRRCP